MKFIISILVLVSSSVFAQQGGSMGGQSGNGGNGCWVRNPGGNSYWSSLEEIEYSLYYRTMISNDRHISPTMAPRAVRDEIVMYDMLRLGIAKRITKKITALEKHFPRISKRLLEWSIRLNNVHVVPNAIRGHYGANIPKRSGICVDYSPAMAILDNGTVILFRTVWNSLDNITQEVILIHEVLRLAQMFDPSFKSMDNKELQRFTALISTKRLNPVRKNHTLMEIEKHLEISSKVRSH